MQICTSLQTDNHASTPPLSFLQAGCPSCRPTNSVKALTTSLIVYHYLSIETSSYTRYKDKKCLQKNLLQKQHRAHTNKDNARRYTTNYLTSKKLIMSHIFHFFDITHLPSLSYLCFKSLAINLPIMSWMLFLTRKGKSP